MKRIIALLILAGSIINVNAGHFPAYTLFSSEGKSTDFSKIVKATEGKQFVFFGEYHDNPISHWLQFELTREMYAMHHSHLILGAEMFEADNQFIMDEYLKDLISEKNFQDEVRLWPNYNTDYKPLLEFAKRYKLPFVATNIPRRYANMVYKNGIESLKELSDEAKKYIAPLDKFEFDSTVNCYKSLVMAGSHGGYNMAISQALKDATMAYFILKHSTSNSVFLHYNGAYHSDHYEGIIHYLLKDTDKKKILTISTVMQSDINKLEESNQGLADFIICVPETMTRTH